MPNWLRERTSICLCVCAKHNEKWLRTRWHDDKRNLAVGKVAWRFPRDDRVRAAACHRETKWYLLSLTRSFFLSTRRILSSSEQLARVRPSPAHIFHVPFDFETCVCSRFSLAKWCNADAFAASIKAIVHARRAYLLQVWPEMVVVAVRSGRGIEWRKSVYRFLYWQRGPLILIYLWMKNRRRRRRRRKGPHSIQFVIL